VRRRRFNRSTAFLGIVPGDRIDDVDLEHIERAAGGSGFHGGALVVALCQELRREREADPYEHNLGPAGEPYLTLWQNAGAGWEPRT
jgi:hypothetical protein